MSPPPDFDALSPAELKSLVLELFEKLAESQRTIAALRDEIVRLKGGPGRPDIKANIKPSGMEKASEPEPRKPVGKERRRGGVRAKLTIHEERKLEADAPAGSRFKGYASFVVQDLAVRPHVTDFLRECWRTPDGKTVTAPLPPGVDGHFGPELRRLVLALYHQGQVTVARLVTLLRGFGILISKRQAADRPQARLPGRSPRRTARRLDQGGVDHSRRHRGAAQGQERLLHPDRQRLVHLVRDHRFKEPPELSRTVARRTWRLRRQPGSADLHARPRPRRTRHHVAERASRSHLRRSGGLERTPGPARRLGLEGPSRSRADRQRSRRMGQRQGAWLSRRRRDRQRRRWPIQCRSSWSVLDSWRTPGSQARYVHRSPTRRAAPHPRPDLAVLWKSQSLRT